jgi:hypothetical protein
VDITEVITVVGGIIGATTAGITGAMTAGIIAETTIAADMVDGRRGSLRTV